MTKKPIRANLVVRIAFTLIFIFLFVSVINLQVEMNELRKLRDERVQAVAELQDDVDELELRIAEPIDDEFIERIAPLASTKRLKRRRAITAVAEFAVRFSRFIATMKEKIISGF